MAVQSFSTNSVSGDAAGVKRGAILNAVKGASTATMTSMSGPWESRADDDAIPHSTPEIERASADRLGIEQPVQPLRTAGSRGPIAMVCVIVAIMAVLVWQPWGRAPSTTPSSRASQAAVIAADQSHASPSRPSSPVGASGAPSSPPALSASAPQPYVSLIDNEWTVVALLSADGPVSTEEPSIQHGRGFWSPGDPLLVLQQGLDYTTRPIESRNGLDTVCLAPAGSRARLAVHLPTGRVAYLGVTFPGMDPGARVTVSVLGRHGLALPQVTSPVVQIRGLTDGRQYRVPSSGSGAAVLFTLTPPSVLPSAAFQFDIVSPGIAGHRYLYACIGS